jgi:hypothetical protein
LSETFKAGDQIVIELTESVNEDGEPVKRLELKKKEAEPTPA